MVRHSRLAKEGQQRARAAGVKFGPKRKWTDAEAGLVRTLRSQGQSYGQIAKGTGKTISTVRRILGVT
jgi:DNA invertase Pin-like site-specific DNA recombinase